MKPPLVVGAGKSTSCHLRPSEKDNEGNLPTPFTGSMPCLDLQICTCTTSFLPQPPLPPLLTCDHCHRPNALAPFLTPTGKPCSSVRISVHQINYRFIFVHGIVLYCYIVPGSRVSQTFSINAHDNPRFVACWPNENLLMLEDIL